MRTQSSPQVQVRLLSGRTALVEGAVDVAGLFARISAIEGVPAEDLRLTACGRELREGGACAAAVFEGAPVAVLLRLAGGKGGFGAMLRTAGARGIKTTNFDACRDLYSTTDIYRIRPMRFNRRCDILCV